MLASPILLTIRCGSKRPCSFDIYLTYGRASRIGYSQSPCNISREKKSFLRYIPYMPNLPYPYFQQIGSFHQRNSQGKIDISRLYTPQDIKTPNFSHLLRTLQPTFFTCETTLNRQTPQQQRKPAQQPCGSFFGLEPFEAMCCQQPAGGLCLLSSPHSTLSPPLHFLLSAYYSYPRPHSHDTRLINLEIKHHPTYIPHRLTRTSPHPPDNTTRTTPCPNPKRRSSPAATRPARL